MGGTDGILTASSMMKQFIATIRSRSTANASDEQTELVLVDVANLWNRARQHMLVSWLADAIEGKHGSGALDASVAGICAVSECVLSTDRLDPVTALGRSPSMVDALAVDLL